MVGSVSVLILALRAEFAPMARFFAFLCFVFSYDECSARVWSNGTQILDLSDTPTAAESFSRRRPVALRSLMILYLHSIFK